MENEMNFCPGCGQRLQPGTNFCPKCGRNLSSGAQPKQKGFNLSKLKDSVADMGKKAKESKIGAAAAGAASGVVSKFKSNVNAYKQWDGELIRTRPLLLPEDTPDTPVFKGRGFGSMSGKTTSPKYGRLVLTRKSILFYDVPTAKTLLPGRHVADKLEFTVNLADIESFKKETNKLGTTGYSMMVRGAYCLIDFCKDPSKFILYITRLAGLDGNLLNIKLREGEKVVDTGNISVKTGGIATINTGGWQFATMYLTTQRIVINKAANEMTEGGEMIFEKDRSAIDEITEEKNAMNCVYTIKGYGEPVILKFSGLVPSWFLGLVKNGEGNAKQLKRKSNLMKGAKVAMIAASVLGAASDVSAETDVDTDVDYDVDGDMVDMDGDGIDDAMLVDTDGDGFYDSAMIDTDGDGAFDSMAVDVDGDGNFDAIGVDTDGDGAIDTMAVDADGDGTLDTLAVDVDGDGSIDAMGMDTNGDGAIDTVVIDDDVSSPQYTAVDVDGDGTIDAVGVDVDGDGIIDGGAVDTDGNGSFDTVVVDADGDGAIDAVGVDTDGDGTIDTVGVDTDGDGSLDSIGIDTDGDGAIDTIGVDTDGDGRIDAVGVDMDGDGTIDKVGVDTDGNGTIDTITNIDHGVGHQSPTGKVKDSPTSNTSFAPIAAGAAAVAGAAKTAKAKAQGKYPKDNASNKNKTATPTPPPKQAPTQLKPEQPKKANRTPLIIGIVAGVVVLAIVAVLLLMKEKKQNQEQQAIVVEQQLAEQQTQNESKLKGYEWLEGVWAGAEGSDSFGRLIVTDSYIQVVNSNMDDAFANVEQQKKEDYSLQERPDYVTEDGDGTIFGFNEFIGVGDHFIYIIQGEFNGVVLDKIQAASFEDAVFKANHQYPARVYSNAYDGFVNIRQSPSSKSPILGVLKNGPDGAVLISREGDWTEVNCQGIEGYVASQYIQDTPTEVFKGGLNDLMGIDAGNYQFTESDLTLLSAKDLTYLRNSVYAKHGYVFVSDELNNYFKQFKWYHPNSSVTETVLNDKEKVNVNFIKRYQEQNGKTYKPQ